MQNGGKKKEYISREKQNMEEDVGLTSTMEKYPSI